MKKIISLAAALITSAALLVSCSDGGSSSSAGMPASGGTGGLPADYAINNDFWDNANVYFAITDRFYNGDTSNDRAYGRSKGSPTSSNDLGKFMGGDIVGLTQKLDYLENLGVNAIWITAPYEQIHGWCVGGGNFEHYPYHGYYALDYTNMDANIGTKEQFRAFVDAAHAKGIRVIMDIVMNHPGYNTFVDAKALYPEVLNSAGSKASLSDVNVNNHGSMFDYSTHGWDNWWGGKWIRAGFCSDYTTGSGDLTGSCGGYLPDFITEGSASVALPTFLKRKHGADMATKYPVEGYEVVPFEEKSDYTVRKYLVYWLSSWVREFGIDGFRCDTAKHVEMASWKALKIACVNALRDWKEANPDKAIANSGDFWMTGEHYGLGISNASGSSLLDSYVKDGLFNSMINFELRSKVAAALDDVSKIEAVYSKYAVEINENEDRNVLSFISNHDTKSQDSSNPGIFYSHYGKTVASQRLAGSLLAFTPGAIQIYYGDECGRKNGSSISGDLDQQNRSVMPWPSDDAGAFSSSLSYSFNAKIQEHWAKVLNFRKNHPAVGGGAHSKITVSDGYAFSRIRGDDKVVVVLGATAGSSLEIDVSSIGSAKVRDAYTDTTVNVSNGKATFTVDASGVVLIEAAE